VLEALGLWALAVEKRDELSCAPWLAVCFEPLNPVVMFSPKIRIRENPVGRVDEGDFPGCFGVARVLIGWYFCDKDL
jgi:hypothetical protein